MSTSSEPSETTSIVEIWYQVPGRRVMSLDFTGICVSDLTRIIKCESELSVALDELSLFIKNPATNEKIKLDEDLLEENTNLHFLTLISTYKINKENPIIVAIRQAPHSLEGPISTSALFVSNSIMRHPNYLHLNNFDFLDTLTEEEKSAMRVIYQTLDDPSSSWKNEVKDMQPWIQNLYEKIADYFGLVVNHDMRIGYEADELYSDHYLTFPKLSSLCDNTTRHIDHTKCYGFDDTLNVQADKNTALIQCHRYSRDFLAEPKNREHKYISIINDGFCYVLWYAYHDKAKGMMGGLTNAMYWDNEHKNDTVEILGRVFKTFKNTNIDIDLPANDSKDPFLDQHSMNDALYSVILEWAKRSLQTGLPIVKTSIGDVEACRLLGTGFNTVVFEARTTGHVRVALKYSMDDNVLKHETQILKKLEGLDGIPNLLYEKLDAMIPYIVTNMVGKKITEVDIPTACNIISDILKILKNLHEYGYIHNDIHPSNIVNSYGKFRLIDFGFVIQRSDKRDPIPTGWLEGNSTFASHNRGKYPGAGDDLEALCYTVAFMYNRDKEYWRVATQDQHEAIHQKEEKLFHLFDGLPQVFRDFFNYVYDLDVTATPNYEHWQQQFQQTARNSHSL